VSPGSGMAVVLSIVVAVAGAIVVVLGAGSLTGSFGWVLIVVGVLFAALNLMVLRRGR